MMRMRPFNPCDRHSGASPTGQAFGLPDDKLREEPEPTDKRGGQSWVPGSTFGRPGMTAE
jgi:hypothetical protein